MMRAHQHFCSCCYAKRGHANRRGYRGWWRCLDRKCVRLSSAICPEHAELLARRRERLKEMLNR